MTCEVQYLSSSLISTDCTFTNSSVSDTSPKMMHMSTNVSSIVDAARRDAMHSALLVDLKNISEGMPCLYIDACIQAKMD